MYPLARPQSLYDDRVWAKLFFTVFLWLHPLLAECCMVFSSILGYILLHRLIHSKFITRESSRDQSLRFILMSRGLFPVMSFPSTLKNYQDYRLAYISDEYINASNYFLLKLPLFLRVLLDMNFCTLWQIKSILLERHCIFLFSSCFSSQAKSLNHSTGAGSGENDMFLSKQHL